MWYKNVGTRFFRVVTMHVLHRQTDGVGAVHYKQVPKSTFLFTLGLEGLSFASIPCKLRSLVDSKIYTVCTLF